MVAKFAGFNLDSPLIMGIVNITHDSFSDGGETLKTSAAISRAINYIDAGANILVSGTTIFKDNNGDIKKNIELLRS